MRPSTLVMFDGQSLNNVPDSASSYPSVLMAGRSTPWANVSMNGASWTALGPSAAVRVDAVAQCFAHTVLVFTGGTSDITQGDTAAQLLADMEAYAALRRAAGHDVFIASTITPFAIATAPQEAVRVAVNDLIRASSAWEAVADMAAHPSLDDPNDVTYYVDGTHFTAAGAAAAAAVVAPVLESVL